MMKKNFTIDKNVAIQQNDGYYDLHNCYEFESLSIVEEGQKLKLAFKPHKTYGEGLPKVILAFSQVDFLLLSSLCGTTKTAGLDEIGYKNYDDFNDSYIHEEKFYNEKSHIHIRMHNHDFIRVHSKTATVLVDDNA